MYKGPLIHSLLCSEFVELTFLYAPSQEVDLPLFFIAHESGGKTSFIQKVLSLRLFCKRRQMGAQLLSYSREFSFILEHVFIAFKMPCCKVLGIKEMPQPCAFLQKGKVSDNKKASEPSPDASFE